MNTIETTLMIILVLYGVLVTYMWYDYYKNMGSYMKEKSEFINNKIDELDKRDRSISDKEVCDKELMRIKTIHKSALDVLNSYTQIPTR